MEQKNSNNDARKQRRKMLNARNQGIASKPVLTKAQKRRIAKDELTSLSKKDILSDHSKYV